MNFNANASNMGRGGGAWKVRNWSEASQQEHSEWRHGDVGTKTWAHETGASTFCAEREGGVPQSLGGELPPQRRH